MGAGSILYYAIHFHELRNIIQWKTWHQPVHERDPEKEDPSLQKCFYFLDMTSRSFAVVIKELHPELLVPIALFYLILRGMDTVEDDMTIPMDQKEPVLRNFYKITEKEGWSFDGNHVKERDRELLVHFYHVTKEFRKVKPVYKDIINDITEKMGNGMAEYCKKGDENIYVETIQDYYQYCHYVAGLVANGLTRLFVESGLANPALNDRPHLQRSMGHFLQKTNIIRDIREDYEDNRRFWPREVWSKYVNNFEDLFKPENQEAAVNCSSELVLDALNHADECLFYLAGIKEQSVFNFCAIPQAMAVATLVLVFRNPAIFKSNIKITKGEACRVMLDSTQNLRVLSDVYRRFVREIHKKNTPKDPNFLKISITCGKIEQFIDSIFPTQDPKALVQAAEAVQSSPAKAEKDAEAEEARQDLMYMMVAVMGTLFTLSCLMIGVAWLFGARFDVAIDQLKNGQWRHPDPSSAESLVNQYDHGEL
ncbi:MAG: hypothetical protein LQ342_006382 [Letrouitia transgressa]|nr:MAG: hypothetical protein LQ342_006382 [Letrouitia transgressa]